MLVAGAGEWKFPNLIARIPGLVEDCLIRLRDPSTKNVVTRGVTVVIYNVLRSFYIVFVASTDLFQSRLWEVNQYFYSEFQC